MLYVTTRNTLDAFTPKHTLENKRGPDGGCFVPFHVPSYTKEEIACLKDMPFNLCMANMLGAMFSVKLSSWDVDFCIGRYPVRLQELGSRILMGETWHNPDWQFSAMADRLVRLVGGETGKGWPEIAVRIAVLFGMYGELLRQGTIQPGEQIDVSALSGSFAAPMSAWYARQWGLPIGNIICCCNENNELWNLICHGQFRTDTVCVDSCIPEADVVLPEELERLISTCDDVQEMEDYLGCCQTGRTYYPSDMTLAAIKKGLFVSVVSSHRIRQTIPHAYATHRYLMSPETALAYAGMLDYRAKKGQQRYCVVLSEKSPVCDAGFVAQTMGISEEKLRDLL